MIRRLPCSLPRLFLLLLLFAAVPALLPASGAQAQAAKDSIAVEDIESLIRTLEDDAERKRFVERLKQLVEARRATGPSAESAQGFMERFTRRVRESSGALAQLGDLIADLPVTAAWIERRIADDAVRDRLVEGVWKTLLALLAGLVGELLTRLLFRRPRRLVEERVDEPVLVRAVFMIVRIALDLLPLAVFTAAAYGVMLAIEPGAGIAAVGLALIFAIAAARGVAAIARGLFAPRSSAQRLFPMSDETAAYLYLWSRRMTFVIVYGYGLLLALVGLGLPEAASDALLKLIGLTVAAMGIVFVMQNRRGVADWVRARAAGLSGQRAGFAYTVIARLGDIWHVLAILYILAILVVWMLDLEGGFAFLFRASVLTAVILVATRLAILGMRRGLARLFRIDPDLAARNPRLEERANRYLPAAKLVLAGLINLIALVAVLQVWGLDVLDLLLTEEGRRFVGSLVTILFIMVGTIILWELASAGIARYLAREENQSGDRGQRVKTLLPLLQKALLVALIIMVSLIVLAEVGVNIGPLLAGAGVLGLAIGFGAQTLVRDLITGLFNLIEDTIGVGDVVSAGGHIGVVEAISLRSVRLRDYSGIVHTIPFSSVTVVENYTKDFSYAVIDIGVAYRENVDEVIAALRDVAAELRADEHFRAVLLDDLEVAGVQDLGDSSVVIRSRFRTAPGNQWGVRREMLRRVKAEFDRRGIEIPYPHMTLYFGAGKDGSAPPAHLQVLAEQPRTGGPSGDIPPPDTPPGPQPEPKPEPSGDGAARKPDEAAPEVAEQSVSEKLDPGLTGGDR